DDVGVGQLLAHFRLVNEEAAVHGLAGLLGQQQLHGEMPVALAFHHLPDLAGLARHPVLEQLVTAHELFRHVSPPPIADCEFRIADFKTGWLEINASWRTRSFAWLRWRPLPSR